MNSAIQESYEQYQIQIAEQAILEMRFNLNQNKKEYSRPRSQNDVGITPHQTSPEENQTQPAVEEEIDKEQFMEIV